VFGDDDDRQTTGGRRPDPEDSLSDSELPPLEGKPGEGPSGQNEDKCPQERLLSPEMVTEPTEGKGAECRQPGKPEKETHFAFAKAETDSGEGECRRRLGLGESLDQPGEPHNGHQETRITIEPTDG
jgi:hypothetical protein